MFELTVYDADKKKKTAFPVDSLSTDLWLGRYGDSKFFIKREEDFLNITIVSVGEELELLHQGRLVTKLTEETLNKTFKVKLPPKAPFKPSAVSVPRREIPCSVIIPTYNMKDTLKNGLTMLLPQLSKKDEVLVVDDGSSDGTREMVAQQFPSVRHVYQTRKGPRPQKARNKGIHEARNECIIMLDADCTPLEGFVRAHKYYFHHERLSTGTVIPRDAKGRVSFKPQQTRFIDENNLDQFRGANLCFSRSKALKIDGFTQEYDGAWGFAEFDFACKMMFILGNEIMLVPEARVIHEYHPTGRGTLEQERNKKIFEKRRREYLSFKHPFKIGWVGQTTRKIKRFKPAKRAVSKIPRALLKVAGDKNFIPHKKMRRFYGFLDCLLVSSQTEGHPLILYEAMACGVPVVTTDVGDVADVIRNGYNGILLRKSCTIKDVTEGLLQIRDDPEKARRMGLRGMIEIHRNWTWDKWIPRYVEMFNYVLEKTNNPKKSDVKVLILVDVLDWAWGFMAQEMAKFLPPPFVCDIKTYKECKSGDVQYEQYDIIYNHLWMKMDEDCYRSLPVERMIIHVGGEAFHDPKFGKLPLFNSLVNQAACISSVSKRWLPELEAKGKTFYCSRGVDTSLFKPAYKHKIILTFVIDEPRWTYGILAKEISRRLPPHYWNFIAKPQHISKRKLDKKSDIIYNWMWALGVSRRLPRSRTIVGVNGEKYLTNPDAFAEAVENSFMILVNSTKIYEDVRKLYPPANVRLAHTGIDADLFKPNPIEHKGFTVGWIGNRERKLKRYSLAKEAVENVDGVIFNPLFFQRDRPELLIPHQQMPSYYNSLDLHLLVSTSESHSQQTYEAMACGLPVITTNVGCIDHNVRHMENGILLPVDCTVEQIRDAIRMLRKNPELRRRLGENARKTILERVTWNHPTSIPAYIQAFEEVILGDG